MKIAMLCFSLTGLDTGERLKKGLEEKGFEVVLDKKSKYIPDSICESHAQWTERQFGEAEGIIFICACGIAVRSIAPFVKSKKKDPAVLVIDECGRFVISLLSGHLGGANELAQTAAEVLKAQPVITTATDLHGRFAVDVFAKKNRCGIFGMVAAKEVSAALLAGEPVGFYSEFPWEGDLPEGLVLCDKDGIPSGKGAAEVKSPLSVGVAVTIHRECLPFLSTAQVVPEAVALGMGCRKDKEPEGILAAASECILKNGIFRESLEKLVSIELKKDERGLKALAKEWELPFITYSEAELKNLEGDFTPSTFVKNVTGVDNVCERSAVLGSENGTLIQRKVGQDGVTTALAVRKWRIQF